MNALEVRDVSFAYGARQALCEVSFSLAPGRFAALLGPNGAGKSTLIALLTRLYDLQSGDIRVGGHSLREAPRAALTQLGVVFQQSTLDLDLSVEQNLDPASRLALNQHVRNLCAEHGISVLWTTHLLDEVQADDALMILHQGRLVASGQVDELIQQQGGDLGSVFARLTRPTVTGAAA